MTLGASYQLMCRRGYISDAELLQGRAYHPRKRTLSPTGLDGSSDKRHRIEGGGWVDMMAWGLRCSPEVTP